MVAVRSRARKSASFLFVGRPSLDLFAVETPVCAYPKCGQLLLPEEAIDRGLMDIGKCHRCFAESFQLPFGAFERISFNRSERLPVESPRKWASKEVTKVVIRTNPADLLSESKPDRRHITVLFGDIVGSTELLVEMGDLKWMDVVKSYYAILRCEYESFGGRYLTTSGDGFLAAFDRATNAVDCASAILRSVKLLGLKMRIGVHAGECFDVGEQLIGLTLHVGARIATTAAPNEVLVSNSVKNQIADSDVRFLDRGTHNLKGVPGEWQLFAAR